MPEKNLKKAKRPFTAEQFVFPDRCPETSEEAEQMHATTATTCKSPQ